ncbi:MAG: hypothetical protein AB1597_04705 [Chloroflexota bacterium]
MVKTIGMSCLIVMSLIVLMLAAGCPAPATTPAAKTPSSPVTTPPATPPAVKTPPTTTPPATSPGALTLDFVSATETTPQGGPMKVTVKTAPGAKCVLTFINPDTGTRSAHPADKERIADSSGLATWEWEISKRTHEGQATIEVVATLGDKSITKTRPCTVKN